MDYSKLFLRIWAPEWIVGPRIMGRTMRPPFHGSQYFGSELKVVYPTRAMVRPSASCLTSFPSTASAYLLPSASVLAYPLLLHVSSAMNFSRCRRVPCCKWESLWAKGFPARCNQAEVEQQRLPLDAHPRGVAVQEGGLGCHTALPHTASRRSVDQCACH